MLAPRVDKKKSRNFAKYSEIGICLTVKNDSTVITLEKVI